MGVVSVLDEDPDHHDKNDSIEEQDDKDGAQEGSKEYHRIRDKAAIERSIFSTKCECHTYTVPYIQQLTILQILLWVGIR